MIHRVFLDRDLLIECWLTAKARFEIKHPDTNRRISDRPDIEILFDGLRSECATAIYYGMPELVSWTVTTYGDGGSDLLLFGQRSQVKSSIRRSPRLIFNITGKQAFTADLAILTRLPQVPSSYDPVWHLTNNWVDLIGWISREEFMAKKYTRDFGYGDRYAMDPPLHDIATMEMALTQP
jgi:hypothetical protein